MGHGLKVIRSSDSQDPDDHSGSDTGSASPGDQPSSSAQKQNQESILIDATFAPVDIRHPTDLSLLNVDEVFSEGVTREVTKILIDAMHPQIREYFGHKPRTHRKKARHQFLAVAKKKKPRINKNRKAIKPQLGHLKRNLASIDALIACGGLLLAAGRQIYHKLLVVSELVRQQSILYHADSRSIPDRIVSLDQSHIRPIVREKARCNVEFGAKTSITVTDEGFTFLDRLSYDVYNEGEYLKAQAVAYRRRQGHHPEVIYADQIYRTRSNRAFCQRHGIRLSGPSLGRANNDPELLAAEKRQFIVDQRQRNAVVAEGICVAVGKIGEAKSRYGLGLIREKLAVTQGSTIAINVLVMNLQKLLEFLFALFAYWLKLIVSNILGERARFEILRPQISPA
jgi:hypothetical protein